MVGRQTPSKRRIILASSSPRRKVLLRQLIGDNFEVIVGAYREDYELPPEDPNPLDVAIGNALGKARAVAKDTDSGVVIGADTFGMYWSEVLGKPKNAEDAKAMLRKISGKSIHVISGIAVIDCDTDKELTDWEVTEVKMKEMTGAEIEAYVKTGEPLDKAASFGMQEKGAVFVEKIDGCSLNVIGLPLYKLNLLLEKVGISVFDYS